MNNQFKIFLITILVVCTIEKSSSELDEDVTNTIDESKANKLFLNSDSSNTKMRQINRFPFIQTQKPVCGVVNRIGRFINGISIKSLPYSWIIPIIVLFNPNDELINTRLCSGTLIHEGFVLTAASCFKGIADKESTIRIGFNILNITNVYEGYDEKMQEMKIFLGRNLYLHPLYTQLKDNNDKLISTINDIALIRLDHPTNLMPVCVPYSVPNKYSYPRENTILNVYSWGKIKPNDEYPDDLKGTRFRVDQEDICAKRYFNQNYESKLVYCGKNYKTQTCGYLGDIGAGAYIYDENNIVVLAGILTMAKYDDSCEKPDIFQRVSIHVEWIHKIIKTPIS